MASRTPSLAAAQSGTHTVLVFVLVGQHMHSVIFLKPTVQVSLVTHTCASDSASG